MTIDQLHINPPQTNERHGIASLDIERALDHLTVHRSIGDKTLQLWIAGRNDDGAPDYSRIFPRDGFMADEVLNDEQILHHMELLLLETT